MIAPRSSKIFLTALCSLVLCQAASAQRKPKPKDFSGDLKFDDLPSPQVNIGVSKKFRPKDWLEIEVTAELDHVPTVSKKEEFHNSVSVAWNIIVKGQDGKGYWIKKTVEHVNVPSDEEVVFSIYLSPNTLKRITGKENAGKNDLEAIGGDININGERAGFFKAGRFKTGWWVQPAPDGITVTDKYPILSKDQTPFKLFWYDRYAEIKPKES